MILHGIYIHKNLTKITLCNYFRLNMIEHAVFLNMLQNLTILISKYLLLLCLKKFIIILLEICCPILAMRSKMWYPLKVHGNEADFLGFLQKMVPHRSLTLLFELFRFWLRIRGDIRNQETTPRFFAFGCLKENSSSLRVGDSPTRLVGESPWWVGESLFEFFLIYRQYSKLETAKPAL